MDRRYYPKRVGWRWEIWWKWEDGRADKHSGATEWRALWGVKFWRFFTALRVAGDMNCAYSDGTWAGVTFEEN